MAIMNAIAEIDKAGRLVVPKKFRDSLHLIPGTRLFLHQEGARLVMETEAKPRGLYMKKGTLVYDAGPFSQTEDVDWAQKDREARISTLLSDLSRS
jgi:AbrB family looped-hinge helix DNA binding protein